MLVGFALGGFYGLAGDRQEVVLSAAGPSHFPPLVVAPSFRTFVAKWRQHFV